MPSMQATPTAAFIPSSEDRAALFAALKSKDLTIATLTQQIDSLKHRIEWFERQMFGQKSERLVMDPSQLHLGDAFPVPEQRDEARKTIPAHERRVAKKDLTESGESLPFFDASRVPVETITLKTPEQETLSADQYEVISEKVSFRLAQRPGSYVVLKYVRPVIKVNDTQRLCCAPAPVGVLEGSRADVSFAAGLVLDKCAYHLPFYRQHQRMIDCGITVSRPWLTQLGQQIAELLRPIYDAQFISIRLSRVITMDETPIKAGKTDGKMKQGYFSATAPALLYLLHPCSRGP